MYPLTDYVGGVLVVLGALFRNFCVAGIFLFVQFCEILSAQNYNCYKSMRDTVPFSGEYSEFFSDTKGTKQGSILASYLFTRM